MDPKVKAMAEKAIANIKPFPGYERGVLDAAIHGDTIAVILLDGRKMIFDIEVPNMGARRPAPAMNQPQPPAPDPAATGDIPPAQNRPPRGRATKPRKKGPKHELRPTA